MTEISELDRYGIDEAVDSFVSLIEAMTDNNTAVVYKCKIGRQSDITLYEGNLGVIHLAEVIKIVKGVRGQKGPVRVNGALAIIFKGDSEEITKQSYIVPFAVLGLIDTNPSLDLDNCRITYPEDRPILWTNFNISDKLKEEDLSSGVWIKFTIEKGLKKIVEAEP